MKRAPQEIRTFFVTAVAWERRAIFGPEKFAQLFVSVLNDNRKIGRFSLHEFVIMPDHAHLLLTPAKDVSLEKAVQFIKGGFSFRAKKELGSNLEIWQPGFTEHRVKNPDDYERHADYIRMNPVRAKLVTNAEEYRYSSANATFSMDPAPPGLKPQI